LTVEETALARATITHCLMFDTEALEAATFYVSLFPDARLGRVSRYGANQPMPEGTVLVAEFAIGPARFVALNAGRRTAPSEAHSIMVDCDDQAEIDRLWAALTADGGQPIQCGWLKDRWGVAWQINYGRMMDIIAESDPETRDRVMAAMMSMVKIDVAGLERAYRGERAA
jgi:predicted 3-demethylubiquinone-9 3-methyltransferase (glyoxalase superfamily)